MSKNSDFGRFRWDSSGQVGCCRSGEAHGETLKWGDKTALNERGFPHFQPWLPSSTLSGYPTLASSTLGCPLTFPLLLRLSDGYGKRSALL